MSKMPLQPTLTKQIEINAPPSKVWSTFTNPEQIKLWMLDTEVEVISDWKLGSPIVFRGDLHGLAFENKGVILQYQPDQVLEYTFWSTLSELPDTPENYSVINFVLTELGNQTLITLTVSNLINYTILKHHEFYWGVTLNEMKKLIELSSEDSKI